MELLLSLLYCCKQERFIWEAIALKPSWFPSTLMYPNADVLKPNSCVYLNALIPALYAGPSIRPCNRMGAQGQEAESMHTYTHTLLSPPCKCYRSHSMCSKWFCVQFCVCVSFCTQGCLSVCLSAVMCLSDSVSFSHSLSFPLWVSEYISLWPSLYFSFHFHSIMSSLQFHFFPSSLFVRWWGPQMLIFRLTDSGRGLQWAWMNSLADPLLPKSLNLY